MENNQNRPPRPPLNWTTAHEIVGGNNFVVQINMTDERRPRFSIKVGRKTEAGNAAPFLPVWLDGIKVRPLAAEISRMLTEAEEWIEMTVLNARLAAETEEANRDKPKTRHTGKTERKKNKGKAAAQS